MDKVTLVSQLQNGRTAFGTAGTAASCRLRSRTARRQHHRSAHPCTELLNELAEATTLYVVTGYTDMRKGIDGLAKIVNDKLLLSPYSKALFLFCGQNNPKMKGTCSEKERLPAPV